MIEATEAGDTAEVCDRLLGVVVGLADEGDAVDGNGAGAQGFEREQGVIDGAEGGARDQDYRELPAGEYVDEQGIVVKRDQ